MVLFKQKYRKKVVRLLKYSKLKTQIALLVVIVFPYDCFRREYFDDVNTITKTSKKVKK